MQPQAIKADAQPTVCGTKTGYIKINAPIDPMYSLYVATPTGDTLSGATSETYLNLPEGDYTVYYVDTFGCKSDTMVTVSATNPTQADFSVQPDKGTAPLNVQIVNNSIDATHYAWTLNGNSSGSQPITHFDSTGTYKIGLIAWQYDTSCADTAWRTVYVFNELKVRIPNVFTANNDGVNDNFTVSVNLPVQATINLLNRWGNPVFQWKGKLHKGQNVIWNGKTKDGKTVTDGVYFYKAVFKLAKNMGCAEKEGCEKKVSGTVRVIGE